MARTGVGIWNVPDAEGLVQLGELLLPNHPADEQPLPWAEEHRMGQKNWCPSLILVSVLCKSHQCLYAEAQCCFGSCIAPLLDLYRSDNFYARKQAQGKACRAGQSRALSEAAAPAPCCQQSHHFPAVPTAPCGSACGETEGITQSLFSALNASNFCSFSCIPIESP